MIGERAIVTDCKNASADIIIVICKDLSPDDKHFSITLTKDNKQLYRSSSKALVSAAQIVTNER